MIDLALHTPTQPAVLPVDCPFAGNEPATAQAIPAVYVIDNYPPPPPPKK